MFMTLLYVDFRTFIVKDNYIRINRIFSGKDLVCVLSVSFADGLIFL